MKKIVIGFAGLAGAGKSTAARILHEEAGFTVLPFAAPLKQMSLAYGLMESEVFGADKERPFAVPRGGMTTDTALAMLRRLPFNTFHHDREPAGRITLTDMHIGQAVEELIDWNNTHLKAFTTPRRFMQLLGTEWGRQRIGLHFWVDVWSRSLGQSAAEHFGDIFAVADDCRFENEASAIRREGGIVVALARAGSGTSSGAGHASEDGVKPNVTIENDGDEATLRARVLGLLDRFYGAEAL